MLKLRVLSGPRAGRQIVVTDTDPVTIGRNTGRVRLHDSRVSKLHAEITLTGGVWVLRDNGSSNGSYVNHDLMRGLAELEPGDLLQFGRVLVKVEQADALGMMGLDTAPPTSAFDAVQAIPKNSPPRPDPMTDADDDELDLDALFAAEDGLDSDDDDDFELPTPKPEARAQPPKPETLDTEDDDDPIIAPLDAPAAASRANEKSSIDLSADTGADGDQDPSNQTDGEAPQLVSPKHGPDEDLIQIDDETPDAGKLPGSTVVLPESMMQTAVGEDGEANEGLSATATEAAGASGNDESWDELDAGLDPKDEQPATPVLAEQSQPTATTTPEPTGSIIDRAAAIVAEIDEPVEAVETLEATDDHATDDTPTLATDATPEAEVEAEAEAEPEAETETEAEAVDPTQEAVATVDAGFAEPDLPLDQDEPGILAVDAGADEPYSLDAQPPHDFDPEDADAPPAVAVDAEGDPARGDAAAGIDLPEIEAADASAAEAAAISEAEFVEESAVAQAMPDAPAEPTDQPQPIAAADAPALDLDHQADNLDDGEEDAGSTALAPPQPPEPLDDGTAVKPEAEGASEDHAPAPEDVDDFDIDAAFADLESGLDDEPGKAGASAQTDNTSNAPADSASVADRPTPQLGLVDGLSNSQLDIAFIQDALANLPQVDDQQHPLGLHSQPPTSEAPESETRDTAAEKAPADQPLGSAWAIAAELDDDAGTASSAALAQSPAEDEAKDNLLEQTLHTPPGINPVTLRDPEEPRSSRVQHTSRESIRRFLPAAIILLLVGAGAGYLLANGPEALTGRPDSPPQNPPAGANPNNTPPANPPAPTPNEASTTPTDTDAGPTFQINPNPGPAAPGPPQRTESALPGIGTATAPEPFAEGPRILGPSVNPDTPATTPTGPLPEQLAGPGDGRPNLNPVPPAIANPNPGTTPGANPALGPGQDTADNNPGQDPSAIQEPADGERLVFLVDASGSSIDSLPQMLVWLDQALDNLEDPERFTIIFFKQGQAIEVPPNGLKPMTRELRRTLESDWLSPRDNPVLPSGRSDPAQAITLALSYEPSDIYLLSDASFARASGDMTREQAVAAIVDQLGETDIRLHGVQFFYQDENQASVLQQLATQYEGTYEFVAEARQPDQDPIDLLQELENRNR